MAFYDYNSGLTDVKINSNVTSGMFQGCKRLANVEIGENVNQIGNGAFNGCVGLSAINIPNTVTNIGTSAVSGCTGLTNLEIPNTVTSIGEDAFKDVPHVTYTGTAEGSPWGAAAVN